MSSGRQIISKIDIRSTVCSTFVGPAIAFRCMHHAHGMQDRVAALTKLRSDLREADARQLEVAVLVRATKSKGKGPVPPVPAKRHPPNTVMSDVSSAPATPRSIDDGRSIGGAALASVTAQQAPAKQGTKVFAGTSDVPRNVRSANRGRSDARNAATAFLEREPWSLRKITNKRLKGFRKQQFDLAIVDVGRWFGLAWTVAETMQLLVVKYSETKNPRGSVGNAVDSDDQRERDGTGVGPWSARQCQDFVNTLHAVSSLAMAVAQIVDAVRFSCRQVVNIFKRRAAASKLNELVCNATWEAYTAANVLPMCTAIDANSGIELLVAVAEARGFNDPLNPETSRVRTDVGSAIRGMCVAAKNILRLCIQVAAKAYPERGSLSGASLNPAALTRAVKTDELVTDLSVSSEEMSTILQWAAEISLKEQGPSRVPACCLVPEEEWREASGGSMARAYAEQAKAMSMVVHRWIGSLRSSVAFVVLVIREKREPSEVQEAILNVRRHACVTYELMQSIRRGAVPNDQYALAVAAEKAAALPPPPSYAWCVDLLAGRVKCVTDFADATLRLYYQAARARSVVAVTPNVEPTATEGHILHKLKIEISSTLKFAAIVAETAPEWAGAATGRVTGVAALITQLLEDLNASISLLLTVSTGTLQSYHGAVYLRVKREAHTVQSVLASVCRSTNTDYEEVLDTAVREGWLVLLDNGEATNAEMSPIKSEVAKAAEEALLYACMAAANASPLSTRALPRMAFTEVFSFTGSPDRRPSSATVILVLSQLLLTLTQQASLVHKSLQLQVAHRTVKEQCDATRRTSRLARVWLVYAKKGGAVGGPTAGTAPLWTQQHPGTVDESERESAWSPQQLGEALRDIALAVEAAFEDKLRAKPAKLKKYLTYDPTLKVEECREQLENSLKLAAALSETGVTSCTLPALP